MGGTVKVNTTRFGDLDVDKKDIITLKDGLLGFEKLTRFFIVDPGDQTFILWLQSIEDVNIAFPILEPKIFRPEFIIRLLPIDFAALELETLTNASVYTILTIPQNVTDMSANLKAPIIINNAKKIAKQIVLQDNKLEVRCPIYTELKKFIVTCANREASDIKAQLSSSPNLEMALEEPIVAPHKEISL